MTIRPTFHRLPPPLQSVVKKAAAELSRRAYTRERDALTDVALQARAQGVDPAQALTEAIRAKAAQP